MIGYWIAVFDELLLSVAMTSVVMWMRNEIW